MTGGQKHPVESHLHPKSLFLTQFFRLISLLAPTVSAIVIVIDVQWSDGIGWRDASASSENAERHIRHIL